MPLDAETIERLRKDPYKQESLELLNCLVKQNEDLINLLESEVKSTEETNKRLESIDKRQSKQDRINMPSILVATIAGYCAIHVYYLGEDHLRKTLITLFDNLVQVVESIVGFIV